MTSTRNVFREAASGQWNAANVTVHSVCVCVLKANRPPGPPEPGRTEGLRHSVGMGRPAWCEARFFLALLCSSGRIYIYIHRRVYRYNESDVNV